MRAKHIREYFETWPVTKTCCWVAVRGVEQCWEGRDAVRDLGCQKASLIYLSDSQRDCLRRYTQRYGDWSKRPRDGASRVGTTVSFGKRRETEATTALDERIDDAEGLRSDADGGGTFDTDIPRLAVRRRKRGKRWCMKSTGRP